MKNGTVLQIMAIEAANLARALPQPVLQSLAGSLELEFNHAGPSSRASLVESISNPHYRALVADFISAWNSRASEVSPRALALALLTAGCSEKRRREGGSVELVWTGPDTGEIPLRHTEQALRQVIDSASQRLIIVSYAIYRIPHIRERLVAAARRGVAIDLVIETHDESQSENAWKVMKALGPEIAARCRIYVWPSDKRPRDEKGNPGVLHVKCAVADSRWLLLTSANLTEYAFTVNMELGLLITGGEVPACTEAHLEKLIQDGVLSRYER